MSFVKYFSISTLEVNNLSKISLLDKVSGLINFDTLNSIHSILSQEPADVFSAN